MDNFMKLITEDDRVLIINTEQICYIENITLVGNTTTYVYFSNNTYIKLKEDQAKKLSNKIGMMI